jgi:diguanylate cyclase (GGDEF)-like protein/PAS domain S-box-containing protein
MIGGSRAGGDTNWIERVPTAVVVLAGDDVAAANDAAGALFRVDAAELEGGGLAALLTAVGREAWGQAVRAACEGDPDAMPVDDLVADRVVLALAGTPLRHVAATFGDVRDGLVVVGLEDVTDYEHTMMMLAYAANTTMVIDDHLQILWGPVGRYAAQELGSPWYGRGEANPFGWLHPEDIGRVLDAFTYVLEAPDTVHELTVRTRHVLLEDNWGVATIRAINLMHHPLIRGILIQTHAEGPEETVSLGRTTGSFQSIAQAAPIGIIMSDHLGRSLYWNDVARRLFDLGPTDRSDGATEADVDWTTFASVSEIEALRSLLTKAAAGERGTLTAHFPLEDGTNRWLSVTVAPQLNDLGEPLGWIATFQDLTHEVTIQRELEQTQDRLIHLAGRDPLTDLANRRLFADQLHRAVARMGRDHQAVALLFCDLDSFKPVNDTRGHDAGDLVLVEIADRLRAGIRTNDLAARLGGDEFVVLVEGFENPSEVEVIADRLVKAAGEPIRVHGQDVLLGASIGIAIARPDDTADTLLSRADDLMYQAKAAGKNRYVIETQLR